jgi:TetR/AcrR family transcriptional repressor of nem operon
MDHVMSGTAEKLIDETARLIVHGGYNGFSYADLSDRFGIRKASIHHHFPSKVDLVVAVVERSRKGMQAQIAALESGEFPAIEHLLGYTRYWERCIVDQSAPFCLAGVLAAELPNLPARIADSVRGHFSDLRLWIERILTLGVQQGSIRLDDTPTVEAETFVAAVYGAMLAARAFDDSGKFSVIVEALIRRIRVGGHDA